MSKNIVVLVLPVLFIGGCASKKVMPQSATEVGAQISSEAMNFDAQGSDSKKIAGLSTVHFAFDRSTLDSGNQKLLTADADWIKQHADYKVQIEGNCDLIGSTEYNLALGDRRAKAARNYLVALGVAPSQISTISYGKEKPLTQDMGPSEQALNRRDNFLPVPLKNNVGPYLKIGSTAR